MAEVAISSLVASPTFTASATCDTIAYGFNLNENDWAYVKTTADPAWIQIDFGENKYIKTLRLRGGPDQSGSQVVSLLTSTNGTDWTTIATWSSQTYYNTLSPWFTIAASVRYVRVNRTITSWLKLYYMGVNTGIEEADITESVEATDSMVGISPIESIIEAAEATATFDGFVLEDFTSESAEATDAFGNEKTAYGPTTESAEATDTMDALHLVDSFLESASASDSMEAEDLIRKKIKFPNLQGKHLSLKFESATDGSFALYYLRHKMFKTRELTSDQKHPNTQASHISLKLSNSGSDAFILMYVSEKMQVVTT
jgi:hypothetical protein